MSGSLAGLKVIDLSRILGGPFCTQVLGDHGADIIKIEPPHGDDTRGWGPPFQGKTASYYLGINRNKRDIVIDLNLPAGRELLLQLLSDADVLVENFKTGTLEKWGLSYTDTLAKLFPRLVHCRISGFGADGPLGGLPGYDAVIQAMTGLMSVNGESGGDPLRIGLPIVDMVTGLNATIGILLALQERERSGKGQFVEAALYDSGVSLLHPHLSNYFLSGERPVRTGNAHPNIAPYDTYLTKTTPIFLAVGNDGQFLKLCQKLGQPELAENDSFVTNRDRCNHRAALKTALEALLVNYECKSLSEQLIRAGVPCGPVLNVDEVVSNPHTIHRGMLIDIGDYKGIGSPIKLSRTPPSYRLQPPDFGGQTIEILKEIGITERELTVLIEDGVVKNNQ